MTTDTIDTNRGSTISLAVAFGADLTGVDVALADANQDALDDMTVAFVDRVAGDVLLTLTDEEAATLPFGRLTSFRLNLTYLDGSEQTSNLLWINVQ